jgi:hypothetical protein
MRTAIVYVFPNLAAKTYEPMARRFTKAYTDFPPGETDHDLYVIVNGGKQITAHQEQLFSPLVPEFLYYNNVGKDIGAYQSAAQKLPCDLMVCMGAPTRPRMAGWLDLMVRAVENYGPGVYGCWGFHQPTTHLRTTLFWISTELLKAYPYQVTDARRYDFEHGRDSIALWCLRNGFQANQVTSAGVFPPDKWHHVEMEENLMLDQHCDSIR